MRTPQIGDVVLYTDSLRRDHNALVQCVWSESCINLVIVSIDENKKDSYGRQIEHYTSVGKMTANSVPGCNWRWPDEEMAEYKPPLAV